MLDLTTPGALKLLADQIGARHEEVTSKPSRYSWRLKPSDLGDECVRRLWFNYRWMKKGPIPGTSGRKMDRGTEAEARLIRYLRAGGWNLSEFDPTKIGTKFPQWGYSDLEGHVKGFLDAAGQHPEFTDNAWWNVELKTMQKKYFNEMIAKTVRISHPKYYVQACLYMRAFGFSHTIFLVECTDDQATHFEIIARDDATAERYLRIAQTVKEARSRPAGIGMDIKYFKCKGCTHAGICHLGEPVDRNCRSCINLVAIEGGKFGCMIHRHIPDEQQILAACPQYEAMK